MSGRKSWAVHNQNRAMARAGQQTGRVPLQLHNIIFNFQCFWDRNNEKLKWEGNLDTCRFCLPLSGSSDNSTNHVSTLEKNKNRNFQLKIPNSLPCTLDNRTLLFQLSPFPTLRTTYQNLQDIVRLAMAQRTRPDDAKNRALLFGSAHQRRPTVAPPPAPGVIAASERETLETANDGAVDGLRGRVGEMRHVCRLF